MACATSALDLPLHANLGVMAQRHRRLLRQAHQPAPQTWRVPIRRGTPSCNRALHRRDQRRSQTLRLDGTRKPHPRCCQTRERKVRVDPLAGAGIDLERDNVRIVPPPPPYGDKGFMARNGVDSIIQNTADAYWGNGMRVAIGERLGIAKLHLDLRRGDGPPGARHYNFAALTAHERITSEHREVAAGAIRAIVKAQKTLKADPSISTEVGQRLFPADEAELI